MHAVNISNTFDTNQNDAKTLLTLEGAQRVHISTKLGWEGEGLAPKHY